MYFLDRAKDVLVTPKCAPKVSNQEFEKPNTTVKPDPFVNFAAFDEEDKPINFAIRLDTQFIFIRIHIVYYSYIQQSYHLQKEIDLINIGFIYSESQSISDWKLSL